MQATALSALIDLGQDDELFIKTSIKINFSNSYKTTVFYLPYLIAKLMITNYPITETIDINLSFGESFEGFKLYLDDFLKNLDSIYVTNHKLATKYLTARLLNKNFYKIKELSSSNLYDDVEKMVQQAKKYNCEEMIFHHCSKHTSKTLYYIHDRVAKLPIKLLSNTMLRINKGLQYNINIVSLFNGIKFGDSHIKLELVDDYPIQCNVLCENKMKSYIHGSTICRGTYGYYFGHAYEHLIRLQNNIDFIKHSDTKLVKIISDDCHKILFLPSFILKDLDMDYYNVMVNGSSFTQEFIDYQIDNEIIHKKVFCIELSEGESIDGYCEFIKDYIKCQEVQVGIFGDYTIHSITHSVNNFSCASDFSKYEVACRYNLAYMYVYNACGNVVLNFKLIEKNNIFRNVIDAIIKNMDCNELYEAYVSATTKNATNKLVERMKNSTLYMMHNRKYRLDALLLYEKIFHNSYLDIACEYGQLENNEIYLTIKLSHVNLRKGTTKLEGVYNKYDSIKIDETGYLFTYKK